MSAKGNEVSEQAVQPIAVRAMAAAPKAPSSQVLKRRAAVWMSINSSSGATRARGLIRIQLANHRAKRGRDRSRFPVRMGTVIDRESCVNG